MGASPPVGLRGDARERPSRRPGREALRTAGRTRQWPLPRRKPVRREVVAAGAFVHARPRGRDPRDAAPASRARAQLARRVGPVRPRAVPRLRDAAGLRGDPRARAPPSRTTSPRLGAATRARRAVRRRRARGALGVRACEADPRLGLAASSEPRDHGADAARRVGRGGAGRALRRTRTRPPATQWSWRPRAVVGRLGVRAVRGHLGHLVRQADLPRPLPDHGCTGVCDSRGRRDLRRRRALGPHPRRDRGRGDCAWPRAGIHTRPRRLAGRGLARRRHGGGTAPRRGPGRRGRPVVVRGCCEVLRGIGDEHVDGRLDLGAQLVGVRTRPARVGTTAARLRRSPPRRAAGLRTTGQRAALAALAGPASGEGRARRPSRHRACTA